MKSSTREGVDTHCGQRMQRGADYTQPVVHETASFIDSHSLPDSGALRT